ncbi:hypothetical protein OSB04_un001625 [Centaurea solstitialis]|uniref:Uncharacterized protein n=1 Tax=Centaurea solstitialis TaxID=347529 RepID=A0AA38W2G2_9ASTR|nr:hypothetical protein OSB04_un001625 [Centaurea solstitialis]
MADDERCRCEMADDERCCCEMAGDGRGRQRDGRRREGPTARWPAAGGTGSEMAGGKRVEMKAARVHFLRENWEEGVTKILFFFIYSKPFFLLLLLLLSLIISMAPEASASITPASSEENPSRTTTYHPALTVSNIKSFIPIVLEIEKVQYTSWAELFKIHAKAFLVIDHIVPPRDSTVEPALWSRLDAVVLQWIYGTISNDLLHTILEPDSTAQVA